MKENILNKTFWGETLQRMNVRIVKIEKRNWYVRIFTIKHYKVTLQYNKNKITLNCCAGHYYPSLDQLFYSVYEELSDIYNKENFDEEIKMFNIGEKE